MLYFTYSPAPFARVLSEKLIAISRAGNPRGFNVPAASAASGYRSIT